MEVAEQPQAFYQPKPEVLRINYPGPYSATITNANASTSWAGDALYQAVTGK